MSETTHVCQQPVQLAWRPNWRCQMCGRLWQTTAQPNGGLIWCEIEGPWPDEVRFSRKWHVPMKLEEPKFFVNHDDGYSTVRRRRDDGTHAIRARFWGTSKGDAIRAAEDYAEWMNDRYLEGEDL